MSGEYLSGRAIHVDQNLSNMAINYRPTGFIAFDLAPIVNVGKQSDLYTIFEQADQFRAPDTRRARGEEARTIQTKVSSNGFYCENYALKGQIYMEDKANADAIYINQMEAGRVMTVQNGLFLSEETRMASQMFNTSNVGSSAAVTSSWTDPVNSDPIGDIETAMDNIQDATGYRPNRLLFGNAAWRNARRHNDFINKTADPNQTGAGAYPNRDAVASMFEVDKVLVGGAYQNESGEGLDMVLAPIWGDSVLAYYVPDAPSKDEPSFMYKFRWTVAGIPNFNVIRHPFDSKTGTEELEVGYYQDEVVTGAPLGFLVHNVTSNG